MASLTGHDDAMSKQGTFFTNISGLRERFFVLNKRTAVLHYYQDKKSYAAGSGEKGEVQLKGCHVRTAHEKERLAHKVHTQNKGSFGRAAKFRAAKANAAHNLGLDMFQWTIDDVLSNRSWQFACKTEDARHEWMLAVKAAAGPVEAFHVQVLEVDHLPKTDGLGKCDPQVKITMGAHTHTTVHHNKTYKAIFTQTFEYPAAHLGDLIVEVEDFNLNPMNPSEFIGSHTVTAGELQGLMARGSGTKQMFSSIAIKDRKGNIVRGFDGEETLVTFQISYLRK
jgi:hypothetical protein